MDRFRLNLLATVLIFFWGILFLGLMIAGIAGDFFFALTMIPLGLISLAGCIRVVACLKRHFPYWSLGLPLAAVLATGVITAVVYILMPSPYQDSVHITSQSIGAAALLALAPCALLLFVACSPRVEDRHAYRAFLVLTGIISLLPLALLCDLLLRALRFTTTAYFIHPWWEGLMMLYGIACSPFIGAMLFLAVLRIPDGTCP